MKMTKEEVNDILDDLENIQIIHTSPHGYSTIYTYVTKLNNKYYQFILEWHPPKGHEIDDTVEFTEVEPIKVTTVEWRIKE